MNAIKLEIQPREAKKRNRAKALRATGRVPGVVYGGSDNQLVDVDNKAFERIMHDASSDTVLLDLKLGEGNRLALVQEIQHHPVSRKTLHIDFREVKPEQKVIVSLPTVPTGEAVGVKTGGGTLEHVLRYIKVRGTPAVLPENIEVEVADLDIGQVLHVGDIQVPEGIQLLANPGNPVISISKPRVEIEEEDVADEATEDAEEVAEGGATKDPGEGAS
jgi:large subunit ribosomal protein L25